MSSAPQGTVIGIDGWLSVKGSWLGAPCLWAGPWLFFSITADLSATDSEGICSQRECGVEVDVHLCVCVIVGGGRIPYVCVCVCTLIR